MSTIPLFALLLTACGGSESERVEPAVVIGDPAPPPRASGSDEEIIRAPRSPQRYEAPSEPAALDAWLAERWPDVPVHVADPTLVERLARWGASGETRVWVRDGSDSGEACRPAVLSSDPDLVLTDVDDRVARYGGRRVTFALECGSYGYLACSGGGARWCNLCRTLSLFVFAPGGGHGQTSIPPARDATSPALCEDACPHFDHPDRADLTDALGAQVLFRPAAPSEAIPTFYRTRADCLRDAAD